MPTTKKTKPVKKSPAKKTVKPKKSATAKAKALDKKISKPAKAVPVAPKKASLKKGQPSENREYLQAVGRHKRAVAQVRLYKGGKGNILTNNREFEKYFPTLELRKTIKDPILVTGQEGKLDFSIKVRGGGVQGQAKAARLGIARSLLQLNPTFRISLKKPGFLTRDARKKERKKPGLKGARRAPQWSKR